MFFWKDAFMYLPYCSRAGTHLYKSVIRNFGLLILRMFIWKDAFMYLPYCSGAGTHLYKSGIRNRFCWPRGLRRTSAAVCWDRVVRIPPTALMSFVSVV
jgi:hypothetical protein